MNLKKILIVVAVVIFALAAFGVTIGNVTLLPLGLAVFAGSYLA